MVVRTQLYGPGASVGPPEDELVTAEPPATRLQLHQRKTSRRVEVEDLFGLCDLERIAAQPVDPVMRHRHAARPPVVTVSDDRVTSLHRIGEDAAYDEVGNECRRHRDSADGRRVVGAFDPGPAA